jgi:multidrug transporter EmrE-like cation transporter
LSRRSAWRTCNFVEPSPAALGRWWLDETLDAVQLAGMVVILLGVVRVTTRARCV